MGGKAPAPPDYTGAAEQQALGSRQNIIEQTFANRPNVYTPFGNVTWNQPMYPGPPNYTQGGAPAYGGGGMGGSGMPPGEAGGPGTGQDPRGNWPPGAGEMKPGIWNPDAPSFPGVSPPGYEGPMTQEPGDVGAPPPPAPGGRPSGPQPYGEYDPREWAMNVELPDVQEAALGSQQRAGYYRSLMGEEMAQSPEVRGLMDPLNYGAMPGTGYGETARNRAEEAIYGRAASRLDPMWQQREAAFQNQLSNQGLVPGTEAYNAAMGNLQRARTDAYQTAMNEAIMGGGTEMQRQYQQDLSARQQAIAEAQQGRYGGVNAMNAFLQGQQINMPQFPGFNQAGLAQAPQYLSAAQMGYQGALNQYGANQALLQSVLGGASSMMPFMM